MSIENSTYTVCATKKYKKSVCLVYNLTWGLNPVLNLLAQKSNKSSKSTTTAVCPFPQIQVKQQGSDYIPKILIKITAQQPILILRASRQFFQICTLGILWCLCHDTPGFGSSEPGPSFQLLQLSTYIDLLPWYLNPLGTHHFSTCGVNIVKVHI